MTNKIFTGRNGLTFSAEALKTILVTRSLSVNVFGAPAPKFDSHQSMKNWCEKQIEIFNTHIAQLSTLREVAIECMVETLGQCPECDDLLKGNPKE